jgi:RNA polymerase sigma-70 factor (ECF subfamily)
MQFPPADADLQAMPDDQLMLAYAGGDPAAFDLLYNRHEHALYRFVRRLLGIPLASQVDEVFQDTWLRIVAARASFSPQGATWRTWAFTIAHNLAMDRLREVGREVTFYAHDEDGDGLDAAHLFDRGALRRDVLAAPGVHPSAEDVAFWQAAGRRLLACLDELPADQRAAFLLHHEDGFTVEALAATLDCGFETIKSRLRYALKKLRVCMERYLIALGQAA